MPSVTQRIKQIKQPRGGSLTVVEMNGGPLHDIKENVSAGVVGMVIDYMTRVMTGAPVEEAFHVSFLGTKLINAFPRLLDSRSASRVSMTNPSHGHAASRTSMPCIVPAAVYPDAHTHCPSRKRSTRTSTLATTSASWSREASPSSRSTVQSSLTASLSKAVTPASWTPATVIS